MGTIQRPVKTGGNRDYVTERAAGNITIRSAEVDADLDTVYTAWNSGLLPYPLNSIPGSAIADLGITTAKLADGSVTDPKIVSMSYAKLIGAPTSLPPSGPAGGDLTGTYPNPTVTAAAKSKWTDTGTSLVPQKGLAYPAQMGDVTINDALTPSVILLRTGVPPTTPGEAVGVLESAVGVDIAGYLGWVAAEPWTGTAHGSTFNVLVTAAGTTTQQSRFQLGGAGAAFFPNTTGVRIGDLGTPRERLDVLGAVVLAGSTAAAPADGTIQFTGTKLQGRVGGAWVDIIPGSGGPPSGVAGGDLQGSYPAPTLTPAAKSKWAVAGATLTPVDATKEIYIPTTTPGLAVKWGTATTKGRIIAQGPNTTYWTQNLLLNPAGSAWVQDDATKPSWSVRYSGEADSIDWYRTPVGSTTPATLMTLDATGKLTLPTSAGALQWGSTVSKARVLHHPTARASYWTENLYLNAGATAWVQDDPAKMSWAVTLYPDAGLFSVSRCDAGQSGLADLLTLDATSNLTILNGFYFNQTNPVKGSLTSYGATGVRIAVNDRYGPPVPTAMSWGMELDTNGPAGFVHRAANAGAGTTDHSLLIDQLGQFFITGAIGQKASGTTWSNPSDPRLKDDVTPYARGLADLLPLEPISYRLKAAPDGPLCYGFDAAAVRDVFPECVSEMRMKLAPDDEDETDGVLTFDMHPILVTMVTAIKELASKVAALEAAR